MNKGELCFEAKGMEIGFVDMRSLETLTRTLSAVLGHNSYRGLG